MNWFNLRRLARGWLPCAVCVVLGAGTGDASAAEPRIRLTVRQQQPPAPPAVSEPRQQPLEEPQPIEPLLPVCKPLHQVGIAGWLPQGELPPDLSARCFPSVLHAGTTARPWAEFPCAWEASGLYHLPLYFEDVPLERYGHTLHPLAQPAISAAHFFGTVPMLPYKMGLEPPLEHVYALGYYRPGNPAPKLIYPLPLRLDAASLQSGAVVGLIFLIP